MTKETLKEFLTPNWGKIILAIILVLILLMFFSYTGKSSGGTISMNVEMKILESTDNAKLELFEMPDGNKALKNVGKTDLHNVSIRVNGMPIQLANPTRREFFDDRVDKELFRDKWEQGVIFEINPMMYRDIDNCPEILNRRYSYLTDDLMVECREIYLLESDELKAEITALIVRWNDHFMRDKMLGRHQS